LASPTTIPGGDDSSGGVDYAHVVANFASLPTLGFLCLVAVKGSTGLEFGFTYEDGVHDYRCCLVGSDGS
jgi:hypothetical protein